MIDEAGGEESPLRVLLVDDNDDVRTLIGVRLELTGRYRVVGHAGDAAAAVRAAETAAPEVVVLDLSMPDISGLEAIPLIQAVAPAARIVVMSGYAERSLIGAVLAAGAAGYVEKGLRTDFVQAIDSILGTEQPARPGSSA